MFSGGNEPRLIKAATEQLNKLPFYHSFWNRTTKPSLVIYFDLWYSFSDQHPFICDLLFQIFSCLMRLFRSYPYLLFKIKRINECYCKPNRFYTFFIILNEKYLNLQALMIRTFLPKSLQDLANEILSMFTARKMGKVFFTNSGSEANDSQVWSLIKENWMLIIYWSLCQYYHGLLSLLEWE